METNNWFDQLDNWITTAKNAKRKEINSIHRNYSTEATFRVVFAQNINRANSNKLQFKKISEIFSDDQLEGMDMDETFKSKYLVVYYIQCSQNCTPSVKENNIGRNATARG